MFSKYILYIIPIIFIPTQSLYVQQDANSWPFEKSLDSTFDESDEDTTTNNYITAKNETQIIKQKIAAQISKTQEDISKKIKTIDQAHRNFVNSSMYKVGYTASFLNSTYAKLIHNFEFIDENKEQWSVLTLLENYEQVKAAERLLSQMLRTMRNLTTQRKKQKYQETRNQQSAYDSNIAWSYYDDAGL